MTTYLVLLAEGGIIGYEEIFYDEDKALARRAEWLTGDEDNDVYIYRTEIYDTATERLKVDRLSITSGGLASWHEVKP